MSNRNEYGLLNVITGGMFTKKSAQLLIILHDAVDSKIVKVQAFKPTKDTRTAHGLIESRWSKLSFPAIIIPEDKPELLLKNLEPDTDLIGIDETQFFDKVKMIAVIEYLIFEKKMHVHVSGLDTDFRRRGYGAMPELMALAQQINSVPKLITYCNNCGQRVPVYTERQYDGKPANYHDTIDKIGDSKPDETKMRYIPKCISCHQIIGKPTILEIIEKKNNGGEK